MYGTICDPYMVPYTSHVLYHIWIILGLYAGYVWCLTWAMYGTIYEPYMVTQGIRCMVSYVGHIYIDIYILKKRTIYIYIYM